MTQKKKINTAMKPPVADRRNSDPETEINSVYSGEIRSLLDIDDVENDPQYQAMDIVAKNRVNNFKEESAANIVNRQFIKQSLGSNRAPETKQTTNKKINITDKNADKISSLLVDEWMKGNNTSSGKNAEFIKNALNEERITEEEKVTYTVKRGSDTRRRIIICALSAAAVLTILFTFKTLLPDKNPEALFSEYYTPFEAVAPVTRSSNPDQNTATFEGITYYKQGNYTKAIEKFNELISSDPSAVTPAFFAGITEMELNNFPEAVILLSKVSSVSSEYRNEALWYLGLSYLKTGNKPEAASCFEKLSGNPGYYNQRALKILKSLK